MLQRAVPLPDRCDRIMNHGERLQAQEVHLEHPGLFQRVHVPLRDQDGAFTVAFALTAAPAAARGLRADRHVFVQRPGRDHDAGRVHARVPRQTLPAPAHSPAAASSRSSDSYSVRSSGIRSTASATVSELFGRVRHQLGQLVGFRWLEAEHASHVANHRARLHRAERDDLADRVRAVLLAHVLDDFATPLVAEVHVDVRHRHAVRIQEPLEQQIELQRVDVRDAQHVRHQRTGR